MKSVAMLLFVIVALGGASGCHGDDHYGDRDYHHGGRACSLCDHVTNQSTFWCTDCGQGFVRGERVTCRGCYVERTGGPVCSTHHH